MFFRGSLVIIYDSWKSAFLAYWSSRVRLGCGRPCTPFEAEPGGLSPVARWGLCNWRAGFGTLADALGIPFAMAVIAALTFLCSTGRDPLLFQSESCSPSGPPRRPGTIALSRQATDDLGHLDHLQLLAKRGMTPIIRPEEWHELAAQFQALM
jgi:hypothetical protein